MIICNANIHGNVLIVNTQKYYEQYSNIVEALVKSFCDAHVRTGSRFEDVDLSKYTFVRGIMEDAINNKNEYVSDDFNISYYKLQHLSNVYESFKEHGSVAITENANIIPTNELHDMKQYTRHYYFDKVNCLLQNNTKLFILEMDNTLDNKTLDYVKKNYDTMFECGYILNITSLEVHIAVNLIRQYFLNNGREILIRVRGNIYHSGYWRLAQIIQETLTYFREIRERDITVKLLYDDPNQKITTDVLFLEYRQHYKFNVEAV